MMNQWDVIRTMSLYAQIIETEASNTKELRELVKELKREMDLRTIWYKEDGE